MPQLDPTWFVSQLFWLAVTFAVLYVVLSRLVLPPLQDVIARRTSTIEGDIERAQRLKSQADQARQDYERTLANARAGAQTLIANSVHAHKAEAEHLGKELDQQIEQKLAEASRKIGARKQELLDALAPTAADLASMIVEKLTAHAPAKDRVAKAITEVRK